MHIIYNQKFKRTVYEIFAGEYVVTMEPKIMLSTLLGSCVSVCLQEQGSLIAGMNHFMLPGAATAQSFMFSDDAKYGIFAMEKLINDMMEKGANRQLLVAKVFGGGSMLQDLSHDVAEVNIQFAFTYLAMEGIPVVAYDVGGNYGRKIFFSPEADAVFVQKIGDKNELTAVQKKEREYLHQVKKKQKTRTEFTIFEE